MSRVRKIEVEFDEFIAATRERGFSVPHMFTTMNELCLTIVRRPCGTAHGDEDWVIYEHRSVHDKPPHEMYIKTRYDLALYGVVAMEGYWSVSGVTEQVKCVEDRWQSGKEEPEKKL
jgi:hypothetical protein